MRFIRFAVIFCLVFPMYSWAQKSKTKKSKEALRKESLLSPKVKWKTKNSKVKINPIRPVKVVPYFKAKKECLKKFKKKVNSSRLNSCIRKKQGIKLPSI